MRFTTAPTGTAQASRNELVVARRARPAATPTSPRTSSPRPRRMVADALDGARPERRVAHHAAGHLPGRELELGLDHGQDVTAGRGGRGHAAQQARERDERDVGDRQRHRLRQDQAVRRVGVQARGVGPLHGHDPRVVPQRLRQLAAAHVESIDTRRAALQQAVREAARARRPRPGRSDPQGRRRTRRARRPASRRRGTRMARASTSSSTVAVGSTMSPGFRSSRAPSPAPDAHATRPSAAPGHGCGWAPDPDR